MFGLFFGLASLSLLNADRIMALYMDLSIPFFFGGAAVSFFFAAVAGGGHLLLVPVRECAIITVRRSVVKLLRARGSVSPASQISDHCLPHRPALLGNGNGAARTAAAGLER